MLPKKTIFLIIVLSIIALSLLFAAVKNSTQNKKADVTPTPTIETVKKTAILAFEPQTVTATNRNQTYSAAITLNPNGSEISAVQFDVLFDSDVFRNTQFIPARNSLFKAENVMVNEVKAGKASFSTAISPNQKQITEKTVLGTLEFTISSRAASLNRNSTFLFSPETAVTTLNQHESVLQQVIPLEVIVK